ncbi:unnamed protein product [Ectocarpus sp. 13 AM-2016]
MAATTAPKFSKTWFEEEFSKNDVGCAGAGIFPYQWRRAGYGSNMNYVLLAWGNSIFQGHNDLALIVNTNQLFSRTKCDVASNSVEMGVGWSCVFAPMPHLCDFDQRKDFREFNDEHGMSEADDHSVEQRLALPYLVSQVAAIQSSIARSGVELMEAFANLYEYILSHLQPWCEADIQSILEEDDIVKMRQGNYVGMHIRRTDKIIYDGAHLTETKVYFENAVKYLNSSVSTVGVVDITGLWLSTDDESVVHEVKEMASGYFPGTTPDSVLSITARVPVALLHPETFASGALDRNTYEAMVLLLAEMRMLAGADVFSGTLSSNIGRLVALMRYSLQKPQDSTLSGDRPEHWNPGRM